MVLAMVGAGGPTALFIAHPGHELTLHGWVASTRPTVFVLTDGSGSGGVPRLSSTVRVLERVGAPQGAVFGPLSDRELYRALLDGTTGPFEAAARELADWLVRHQACGLVADAAEGYNPAHDLCRAIAGAAVTLAHRGLGRPVALYEYVVTADRGACVAGSCGGRPALRLSDAELEHKLAAATAYEELAAERRRSIDRDGTEAYRVECLHAVADARPAPHRDTPFYERHGEARVRAGLYGRVIRYRDHVRPAEDAVWDCVGDRVRARVR